MRLCVGLLFISLLAKYIENVCRGFIKMLIIGEGRRDYIMKVFRRNFDP